MALTISWAPAARATTYKLTLKSQGDPDTVMNVTGTATLVNVPSSKSYEVTVVGVNAGGEGPASDPTFYTPQVPDKVTGVTIAV